MIISAERQKCYADKRQKNLSSELKFVKTVKNINFLLLNLIKERPNILASNHPSNRIFSAQHSFLVYMHNIQTHTRTSVVLVCHKF